MHSESTPKGDLVKLKRGLLTEADARAMLERIRWPDGVHCIFPDCGGAEVWRIEAKATTRKAKKADGTIVERIVPERHLYKCKACKRQFSVTKGTIFEDSKIPLREWISVMYRMCSSKRGVSAFQIHREYGYTYESAWFMVHRIRWAMNDKNPSMLMGTIEADETYVGGKLRGHIEGRRANMTQAERVTAGRDKKVAVVGMLERGGNVRASVIEKPLNRKRVQRRLMENIDTSKAVLMTDESWLYGGIEKHLPHGMIRHKSEYVRGEVHTQGIESFWSILKRGIIGTYYHVDKGYLNQYVQEFAFRHNTRRITDQERFMSLLGQVDGRVTWYVGKSAKADS
jgi:transposase-like protein